MKKWEYCIVHHGEIPNLERLNHIGRHGWELCGIDRGAYIYKRELILESEKRAATA